MTLLPATEARENFADIVSRAAYSGERTAISRHGRTVAAVVSADDLRLLELIEEAMDVEAVREVLGDPDQKTFSSEEVDALLGL